MLVIIRGRMTTPTIPIVKLTTIIMLTMTSTIIMMIIIIIPTIIKVIITLQLPSSNQIKLYL